MYYILFIALFLFNGCDNQPNAIAPSSYQQSVAPYSLEAIEYHYRQRG